MKTNVFLAFTSYHLLLLYALALREKKSASLLFVAPEFFGAQEMVRLMQQRDAPFQDVVLLQGVAEGDTALGKLVKRKQNIRFLGRFFAQKPIANVFVGNDARPEAQFLLSFAKKRNYSCKGVYVEDGSAAYRSYALKDNPFWHWAGKLIFGRWWHNLTFLGASPWIDEIRAIFPELLREELKRIPAAPILKQDFLQLKEEPWIREYALAAGLGPDFQEIRAFVVLPHSDIFKQYPRYGTVLKEIFSCVVSNKIPLAVKFHSKESSEELFWLPEKGVFVIPKAVPFELVYLFQEKDPLLILGDTSTSLLTARWLFEKCEILSTAPWFSYQDKHLFEAFSRLHIKLVASKTELESMLAESPILLYR